MLRRKSRWALQNLGYPENRELEILSKDRRCRWRQAAGSILGSGHCWEGRAGLCAPRQSFPKGSHGPGSPLPGDHQSSTGESHCCFLLCILRDLAHEQGSQHTQAQLGLTRLCAKVGPRHSITGAHLLQGTVHTCLTMHRSCSQLPTQRAHRWCRGSAQGAGPSPS